MAQQLHKVGMARSEGQQVVDGAVVKGIDVGHRLGDQSAGGVLVEKADLEVQCYVEHQRVFLLHLFQLTAQGKDKAQVALVLHQTAQIIENILLQPPGRDRLFKTDRFIEHQ